MLQVDRFKLHFGKEIKVQRIHVLTNPNSIFPAVKTLICSKRGKCS